MLSTKEEAQIRDQFMQMAEAQANAVIDTMKGLRSRLPSGMTEEQVKFTMDGVVETVLKNMVDSTKAATRRLHDEAEKFDIDKFAAAVKAQTGGTDERK